MIGGLDLAGLRCRCVQDSGCLQCEVVSLVCARSSSNPVSHYHSINTIAI
jgi:hypothetical protein